MKVILLEDIKGRGKKGEIKDFAPGFANFLIKEKKCIPANKENVDALNKKKEEDAIAAQEFLVKMQELKTLIEQKTFTIAVRVAPNGKILGTVTNKMIAEKIDSELGTHLDKKKITLVTSFQELGSQEAKIDLHPQVKGKIKVELVLEK